ncbi:MAG TPA: ribonuclease E/G, partial [Candidatus Omnitrophota bacterium]|nr:ribonuclease E/G [Candidatus Omnitrophota bacterium]
PEEGVVVRTAAARASEADLVAELDALRADWAVIDQRRHGKPPDVVWRPDPLAALLAEHPAVERVWVDDAAAFAAARARFGEVVARAAGDAFTLHDADEAFDQALAPSVALPCGGRVTFETTAALTAIDVDSGPAGANEANAQAVAVIARHVRLRSLGGQMAVDFVSGGGKGAIARLAAALKEAVAADPVPTHVFGVSPLGLVELTRERRGPALAELMWEVEHRPTTEAAALSALRRAMAEAAHRPGRGLVLVVAADVAADLTRRPAALAEAEQRLGRPLTIRAEPGRAREDVTIEETIR